VDDDAICEEGPARRGEVGRAIGKDAGAVDVRRAGIAISGASARDLAIGTAVVSFLARFTGGSTGVAFAVGGVGLLLPLELGTDGSGLGFTGTHSSPIFRLRGIGQSLVAWYWW